MLERKSFTQEEFITGRTLFDLAKGCLKNIKKAMSVIVSKIKHGKPVNSGQTMEDVYKEVLDEMYKLLKGKPSLQEENPDSSDHDEDEQAKPASSDRPHDWVFNGWMAFLLFGPTAPARQQLNLTTMGDPPTVSEDGTKKDKKQFGREAHRNQEAVEKSEERKRGGPDRGMTVLERTTVARVHQVEAQLHGKSKEHPAHPNHLLLSCFFLLACRGDT
jgi:hypothetical protein